MVFGWFLIENLTHTLPYSLAWRVHTRLGKNRRVFHIGLSIYSNAIFQRRFCFQFGTSSYQPNSCPIPSSPLASEFYLWASLASSMISFSLSPFGSPSWIFPPDLLALHIQCYSRSTQPRFQQLDRYSLYLRSSVVALTIGAYMRRIEMVCVIQSLKWGFCPQSWLIFAFLSPIAVFHNSGRPLNTKKSGLRTCRLKTVSR